MERYIEAFRKTAKPWGSKRWREPARDRSATSGDGRRSRRSSPSGTRTQRQLVYSRYDSADLRPADPRSRRAADRREGGRRSLSEGDARDFVLAEATKPGEPTWNGVDPVSPAGIRVLHGAPAAWRALSTFTRTASIFPHPENGSAKARTTGKQFSRFWMHVRYRWSTSRRCRSRSVTPVGIVAKNTRRPSVSAAFGLLPQATELHVGQPRARRAALQRLTDTSRVDVIRRWNPSRKSRRVGEARIRGSDDAGPRTRLRARGDVRTGPP